MLLFALVAGGQTAFLTSATGLVAAHFYLFFSSLYPSVAAGGRGRRMWFVETPRIYYQLFSAFETRRPGGGGNGNNSRFEKKDGYGTEVRPLSAGAGSGTGFQNPFSFSSQFKGKGQRLGG